MFPFFKNSPYLRICFLILEREREKGQGERDRNIDVREKSHVLPPVHAGTGDQNCSLAVFPDQQLSTQPFGVRDNALTH